MPGSSSEKEPTPSEPVWKEHRSRASHGCKGTILRAPRQRSGCTWCTPYPGRPPQFAPAPISSHPLPASLPPAALHSGGNGPLGQEATGAPGASSLQRCPGVPRGTGRAWVWCWDGVCLPSPPSCTPRAAGAGLGEGRKGEKALLVSLCPCTQHEQEVARHGAEKRGNHERLHFTSIRPCPKGPAHFGKV